MPASTISPADKDERMKQGEKGAWVSIAAYLFLSTLKLFVGHYASSKALFADGLNNATDIVASVAVLIGLRIARKPADADHRYGHRRAETIATFAAAFIMASVAVDVLWDGVRSLMRPVAVTPDPISMWVALFSAGVMIGVYSYNSKLGKAINSQALLATAADNRADVLVSLGAFVGIVGSLVFGWHWLDPVMALVVGLIIAKTAYEIFYEAAHALTDGYDEKELREIKQVIQGSEGVLQIRDLKARRHGSDVHVDAVIAVDGQLSVEESHRISDQIEQVLIAREEIEQVMIHVEPFTPTIGSSESQK
ncbi:cation diffusion facilitator family transporter [Tumebacillus permanentifrigoris]|uniref:Cation diffusion facilitator family transporter n=2 Tax=Tumebacillus permanentifrigoris TaxID=378543 RepID=A0A316DAK7_9BACL|nr:cation diffusion facilitator family transporter [Tumebacillus permanentifrigoris]PWK13427.1 cation diffusion facilitator family transporter [Tumebacillus permanentifrigoris]